MLASANRRRNYKVAGSDPTDGKGVFSSAWIPLHMGYNYYIEVEKKQQIMSPMFYLA